MDSPVARRSSVFHGTAVQSPPSLTLLLRRLEAATSRLEDIASSVTALETPVGLSSTSSSQINGTPTPSARTTASKAATPSVKAVDKVEDLPTEIEEFDKIINGDLAAFVKNSQADPLLTEQAKALKECFEAERTILLLTTKAKKPSDGSPEYIEVYKDIQAKMITVNDVREKNRASEMKDHLALVADGTQTLGWIVVDNKPAEQAAELFGGAQMYGNKILRANKDK
jgi:adenylyl cyclase-associated protein